MFFTTEVKNSGWAVSIGDFGLRPYRYLFGGRTVEIINSCINETPVRTCRDDWRDSRYLSSIVKTACAIALLAPGILLALCFKGLASLFRADKISDIPDDEDVQFYEITERLPKNVIAINIFVDKEFIDGELERVLRQILREAMPHDIVINTPKTCIELPDPTIDALNEFIAIQSSGWDASFRSKIILTGDIQKLEGAIEVSSIAEAMKSNKHLFLVVPTGSFNCCAIY